MKWFFIFFVGIVVVFTTFFAGMYIDSRDASVATATIDINAEPEIVFKWVTEPRKLTRWIQRLKSSKRLSQDDIIVGSLYDEKTGGAKGATYEWSTQVTAFETNKRIAVRSTMRTQKGKYDDEPTPVDPNTATVSDIQSDYVLTKTATGTRVTKSVTATFDEWYMLFFANIARNSGEAAMASDLERLKTKIEADRTNKKKKKKKKKSPSVRPSAKKSDKKNSKTGKSGVNSKLIPNIIDKLEPKIVRDKVEPTLKKTPKQKSKFKLSSPPTGKPVVNTP